MSHDISCPVICWLDGLPRATTVPQVYTSCSWKILRAQKPADWFERSVFLAFQPRHATSKSPQPGVRRACPRFTPERWDPTSNRHGDSSVYLHARTSSPNAELPSNWCVSFGGDLTVGLPTAVDPRPARLRCCFQQLMAVVSNRKLAGDCTACRLSEKISLCVWREVVHLRRLKGSVLSKSYATAVQSL